MKKENQNYRIDTAFSTEKGNYRNLPTAFMYEKALYTKYKKMEYNGISYLIGCNPLKYDNGKCSKFNSNCFEYCLGDILQPIYCNDANLLISLLRLKSKIDKLGLNQNNKKCIDAINKWCVKYGMPFCGIQENISGLNKNDEIITKYNLWGFAVQSFIKQLNELEKVFLAYINLKFPENINRLNGYNETTYKFILEDAFENSGTNGSIKYNSDTNTIIILFSNLFQAALYELALLVSSGHNNSTNDIGICECCNNVFERERKNQKYCENCSPQKAYKRRMSKKITKEAE